MKKGQITMFVIIGVVLLLAAGLFFSINSELSKDKPVLDVPDVSLETRPANQLIESCLEATAEIAIRQVSAQGGYLSAPKPDYFSARGASLIKQPHNIPFWRYMAEDEGCGPYGCPASERPPLCKLDTVVCGQGYDQGEDSIEEHLEKYILEHIDDCLQDLVSLSDFYDAQVGEDKELEIFFTQGKTTFVLTNLLSVESRSTQNTKSLEKFRAELDVDMLKMYDIATQTLSFLEATNFYETQTMNLISVYACDDFDCMPPTDQLSFGKNNVFWIRETVKNRLDTDLLPLMALTSFQNFDNFIYLEPSQDHGIYAPYVRDLYADFSPAISQERFNGYDLTHEYTYSPILFQIDEGDQIIEGKPVDMSSLGIVNDMLSFALTDLRYKYFLTYPLVLTITDKDALNGQGLDFSFAIEVNIAGNKPAYEGVNVYNTRSELISINLNSPDHLVERDVTISSVDKYTGDALTDVNINYVCLEEYTIGVTSLNAFGDAQLITKLPHCQTGGFLKFNKFGYAGSAVPFDNPEGDIPASIKVELWPIVEKEIQVYKRSVKDTIDILDAGYNAFFAMESEWSTFDSTETALITLNKEKETPFDDQLPIFSVGIIDAHVDYTQFADLISSDERVKLVDELEESGSLTKEEADDLRQVFEDINYPQDAIDEHLESIEPAPIIMGVVPGVYDLDLTLFDYGYTDDSTGEYVPAVSIPDAILPGNDGFLGIGSTDDIPLDGIDLSTWVSGGAIVKIKLDEEEIYESDEPLVFYALEIPKPTHWNCNHLALINPDYTCRSIGYCGEYEPDNEDVYCVPFDEIRDVEEYQLNKQALVAPGLITFS